MSASRSTHLSLEMVSGQDEVVFEQGCRLHLKEAVQIRWRFCEEESWAQDMELGRLAPLASWAEQVHLSKEPCAPQ